MNSGKICLYRYIVIHPLSLLPFCLYLFAGHVFADTNQFMYQLKQRDLERSLMYSLEKDTEAQVVTGQAISKTLPSDTDRDGMPDEWEVEQGLDPNDSNDAWLDPDGDEVINLFEYQLGGDINDAAVPLVVTVAPSGAQLSDVPMAIDTVPAGTVLRIAGGDYFVNYLTFETKVVMLQGGWAPDFSSRDLMRFPTVFDGGLNREILYFSNSGGEPVIILDGLRFLRGNGFFGAVNLLAQGSTFMRVGMVNCTITESLDGSGFSGAVSMHSWDGSRSDRTIANTIISGNMGSGIYTQNTQFAQSRWRLIHATISNNQVSEFNGMGIDGFTLDAGVLDIHMYNSIIWGNEGGDIDISRNINFEVSHSDIGMVNARSGATYLPGEEVVNVDPLFVDPVTNNFRLQGTSPVIDRGIMTGIPSIDFEGDPRVFGPGVDFGADEYLAGSALLFSGR